MNDIITSQDMADSTAFFDPRKYKRYFTADNEPVYVPIGESIGRQATISPKGVQHATDKPRKKSPDSCIYYTADDIVQMLGVSRSQAYKVIRSLNEELKEKNVIVQAGRVPKPFFHEKYYGLERMLS